MEDFEEIWEKYYPKLTVYLRSSFGFYDTEDLVQEIMMKVYTNLHRYRSKWSFSTWIYTIAHNCALDALKKNTSKLRVIEKVKQEAVASSPASASAESVTLKNELQAGIAMFIESLPATERQVAFLKYHEQMKYREISRVIKIPEGTVKYHIHNIKRKFSKHYGENYENRR
ncbi:MAG: RNA polymerase sigma factor [Spirochaetales bacterium]|uniref:RNA polymerase sigma factor n=1 Tax=Candidatus Thalassospirochaeta sargassi TaxID=3119039 RepID=A0AAJ1IIX5_9SPIO|nr:RNA polymerase sigma factor [Spirochaetales bacterium]